MDEQSKLLMKQVIDQQINKIEGILDKRGISGQHLYDSQSGEKARFFGMHEIYWLLREKEYQQCIR